MIFRSALCRFIARLVACGRRKEGRIPSSTFPVTTRLARALPCESSFFFCSRERAWQVSIYAPARKGFNAGRAKGRVLAVLLSLHYSFQCRPRKFAPHLKEAFFWNHNFLGQAAVGGALVDALEWVFLGALLALVLFRFVPSSLPSLFPCSPLRQQREYIPLPPRIRISLCLASQKGCG